jgi:type II secretory pathway pseudopilin PulG
MTRGGRGFTMIELLVILGIISLVIMVGIPTFTSVIARWEAAAGVRTVTTALYTARYNAVKMNRSVKFCIEDNRILLKEKKGRVWKPFWPFDVEESVTLKINASPVFSPTGFASPLCSIYVETERYRHKITLSIAGRIKVLKL